MNSTVRSALVFLFLSASLLWAIPGNADEELVVEHDAVSVKLQVAVMPADHPCKAASSWRWGAENACPETVVGTLDVRVDGKLVFVPVSAFADLGSPRNVLVEPSEGRNHFAVIIIGGDAATSYTATLKFQGMVLNERIVRHGEFPADAYEKTIFMFNIGN